MLVKGKFKYRKLKIFSITIGTILVTIVLTCGTLIAYGNLMTYPKPVDKIQKSSELVSAYKNGLYDKNGNLLTLKGINAGNLFLQEGWISPFTLEPLKNDDGTYKKDKDLNLEYPEFAQETFLNGLVDNPNCGKDNIDEWLDYYFSSWWTEVDFKNVKDVGFNTIRLPFYWRMILNDDYSLRPENEAFKYLDNFIEGCKKNDLYVVLDLHGAPGSQNGYEHSGTLIKEASLWEDEKLIKATINLWDYISKYYLTTRKDLSPTIVAYDLMNEPSHPHAAFTDEVCHKVFDRIYDEIRNNNDEHVISMEGCWGFNALPDPKKYGWENVLYQYHFYNWYKDFLPYSLYNTYNAILNIGRWYEVPTLIGEFTFFHDEKSWLNGLNYFDKNHFSWTIWTYKTTVTGSWDNSWGLYNVKLNLDVNKEETKCNVSACDFETYKKFCDKIKTSNSETGFLKETMKKYFNS